MTTDDTEQRILVGARALAARFVATRTSADHFAIVDQGEVQKQIEFLRRRRKELWHDEIKPVIDASWQRVGTPNYRSRKAA